eukprot:5875653-Ditylum_brightwellii.AAC.1
MGAGKEHRPLDAVYKLSTEGATVRRVLCMSQSEEEVKSPDGREKFGAGGDWTVQELDKGKEGGKEDRAEL